MKPKHPARPILLDVAVHIGIFVVTLARGAAAGLLVLGISQPTSAADGEFVNISTHAYVGTGEEVMIGNEEFGICLLGRSLK